MTQTHNGYSGSLKKIGSGSQSFGNDLVNLNIQVIFETENTVRVKITDADQTRWEIPKSIIPISDADASPASLNFNFNYTENPFTFEITRKSDGASIFKNDKPFTFKDQYIELSTTTSQDSVTFGLGESARLQQALKPGHTYTLWAADIAALVKDVNLYGAFPFYLQMLSGSAHGALLLNSNGMDVTVDNTAITFKTVGGIIDLFVFAGPSPAAVVSQYTQVVGRPTLMPYWSLGFHNCKYGYTSLAQVQEVVRNYSAAGIPLDTQWMDIDYMQDYRDFTLDAKNFPKEGVASFVQDLHKNGQHFVPIIDPGIMVYKGYDAYDRGVNEGLFVKDISGGNYLGQVWPGPTHFPDFFNPKTQAYWTDQIQAFHDMVEVDGLWIDMNEVSNFCNSDGAGQVCANTAPSGCPAPGASQTDCCLSCSTPQPSHPLDFPPYSIGNVYGKLSSKTMAMSASHYGNVTEYDAHNLFGLTEQIATNAALTQVRDKRPFLLTRSSFVSSGVHTAKWTGDNGATWDDLKSSIISVMDFNLFGVPMVGADICGFIFDTTEELCARWIEVGAFYPFSRNHNTLGAAPQELYLWSKVTEASKKALALRYQLLPYMYSLFAEAHFEGSTVARPLWLNFPEDKVALTVDRQFMLGSAVLISPVLDQGATSVTAYFPQGLWYPINSIDGLSPSPIDASKGGLTTTLAAALTDINVHVKGGSIVPTQSAAMTTTEARKSPFSLLVALCPGGLAFGQLFWDDGEQVSVENYLTVTYAASAAGAEGSVTGTVVDNTYEEASSLTVASLSVVGVGLACPSSVSVNGVPSSAAAVSCVAGQGGSKINLTGLSVKLNDNFVVEWK